MQDRLSSHQPEPDRAEGPAAELLRRAAEDQPGYDPDGLKTVEFLQGEDGTITLAGPQDRDAVYRVSDLLSRDRNLGSGSLDEEYLFILFRESLGERPGCFFVGRRLALERFIRQAFDHRITRAEVQLILQTLAGQSLQISAVRDRVSIETKKSQSKTVLSKLGFPDLGNLRAVLLARLLIDPETSSQRFFEELNHP